MTTLDPRQLYVDKISFVQTIVKGTSSYLVYKMSTSTVVSNGQEFVTCSGESKNYYLF